MGKDDRLKLLAPRLLKGVAVKEEVGDDVVDGGEVVGIGGD